MLNQCLEYYSLNQLPFFHQALSKLQQLAFQYYSCGYKNQPLFTTSLSYQEIQQLLDIPFNYNIQEIFHYASFFGIITNVIISPNHIEWQFNCYHQRDLFFTTLKLSLREHSKISLL